VVVDLKISEFEAEFVSKMNLYLNAVDEQMRCGDDRESVGIILCTSRNETVAKLALHRFYAPIVVSTWQGGTRLPEVEVADEVPSDMQKDLAGLPEVKNRLIERVSRRKDEIEADVVDAEAVEESEPTAGPEGAGS